MKELKYIFTSFYRNIFDWRDLFYPCNTECINYCAESAVC